MGKLIQMKYLKTGKKSGRKELLLFAIWTVTLFLSNTHLYAENVKKEKSALEKEQVKYYTEEEVDKIITSIIDEALLEIDETAINSARESAAVIGGDALYYKTLSESFSADIKALEKRVRKLKRQMMVTIGASCAIGIFIITR